MGTPFKEQGEGGEPILATYTRPSPLNYRIQKSPLRETSVQEQTHMKVLRSTYRA